MRVSKYVRRTLEVLCLVAVVAQVAGCVTDSTEAPKLSYRLEWNFEGTERGVDDGGWTVTNNKGYEITVTLGYLVAHSIAFLPCRIEDRRSPFESRVPSVSSLVRVVGLGARLAHAGHGDVFLNPVKTPTPFVESLTAGESIEAGSFQPEIVRYCLVHYVLARAASDSIDLPDDVEMVGVTAHVEGYYRRLPELTKTPFTIRSPSANAVRAYLSANEPEAGDSEPGFVGGSVGALAVVTRRASSLFRDIDFENDGRHKIPWQFLKNVADDTTIRVEFSPSGRGTVQ